MSAGVPTRNDYVAEEEITMKCKITIKLIGLRDITIDAHVFGDWAAHADVAVKEAAAISKATRTGILRLVPGWLLAECRQQVELTSRTKAAEDPDGERRRMLDEFAKLGLKATWLVDWLGHSVDEATPDEIADLRQLYRAIREKEITPSAAMAERKGESQSKSGGGVAASAVTSRRNRQPAQTAAMQESEEDIIRRQEAEQARRDGAK